MTYREALKLLTSTKIEVLGERDEMPNFCKAMNIAIAALQKQIPKNTAPAKSAHEAIRFCPVCKTKIFITEKYCGNCGQALEWEEGLR